MFPNVPDSPLSEAPELAEADVSAGLGSWAALMSTETINSCLSNKFDGMAIMGSGTQWPISTVDRSDRSRTPPGERNARAHHHAGALVPPSRVSVPEWHSRPIIICAISQVSEAVGLNGPATHALI